MSRVDWLRAEQEAIALLEQQALTPDRLGADEWARALRDATERLYLRDSPSLTSTRSQLGRLQSELSAAAPPLARQGLKSPRRHRVSDTEFRARLDAAAPPLPDGECRTCWGARMVRTAPLQVMPMGRGVRHAELSWCPDCSTPTDAERTEWAHIPPEHRTHDFTTFSAPPDKDDALQAVREWAAAVIGGRSSAIVIHGATGTGKTHLGCAALIEVLRSGRLGRWVSWVETVELMRDLIGDRDTDAHDALEGDVRRLGAYPILMLDDVGAEGEATAWSERQLYRVIDARVEQHALPTIITTNLTPSELSAHVGARAASRLQRAIYVELGGADMRATRGS